MYPIKSGKPFSLFGGTIHAALVHAATRFDARQEASATRRRVPFNRYAMARYLERIEEAERDISAGASPRAAILAAFNDRLRDALLKAIGEQPATREEVQAGFGRVTYQPAMAP